MARPKKTAEPRTVRVAIVGMGIGRDNGRPIHAHPRAKITALCDLAADRMKSFAEELKTEVAFYTDYRKLCAAPDIDAVCVCTPNQFHVPVALAAVEAGKHVLITKPLADSATAAAKLVAAAEKARVVNMMSLSTRFSDSALWLAELVRRREFGELYYARARSIRRSGIPDWSLGFIEKGGGAFRDMGVHALDTVWWLLGQPVPRSVVGVAGAKFGPSGKGYWDFRQPPKSYWGRYAADDYAGGFIRFRNGIGLQIESFWASHQAPDFNLELFGANAGAKLHPLTVYRTRGGAPADEKVELPKGPGAFTNIANHFIACILDGAPCSAPLRHGLIVQEMMEALLESARLGREVRM